MERIAILFSFALAAVGGCGKAIIIREGTVIRTPELRLAAGSRSPDIPVRDAEGLVGTIGDSAGPIYVVALVRAPEENPLGPHPEVVKLAGYLSSSDYVGLVQITVGTEEHPLEPGVLPSEADVPYAMFRYLDPERIAWDAFRRPKLGTILLIDEHGQIAGKGTIAKPDWLMFRADRMGWEYEREQGISFYGFDAD